MRIVSIIGAMIVSWNAAASQAATQRAALGVTAIVVDRCSYTSDPNATATVLCAQRSVPFQVVAVRSAETNRVIGRTVFF